MTQSAIIVAGGSGTRMGSDTPKQFIKVAGLPILLHTLHLFYNFDKKMKLIVVLPASQFNLWKNLCKEYDCHIPHQVEEGGETRFHSVKNGLGHVNEGVVAVHDGVRPLASNVTISRCFKTAEEKGNAIPVVPVNDSLREIKNNASTAVDRSRFVAVQTPQCFSATLLKRAYAQSYKSTFTDDAGVVEALGEQINLVEGNAENIKITSPADIAIAEALFARKRK